MNRFDIQKLRALPIEGVAQRLGLQVSRHKSLCPFHEDSHPSLTFHVAKNSFRCFACGAHGGVIDFAMHVLGKSFIETCEWLANEHNVILTEWKPTDKPTEPKPFDAARYSRYFEHPILNEAARRFLFGERKLNEKVISWCRLTSFTDRHGIPWLQIPYFDIDGNLIGVQNRNLAYNKHQPSLSPRFKFPYGHTCHIYNLPVLKLLQPEEPLYITEGCSDCWAMLSSGHKAIAVPSATLLKPSDLYPIQQLINNGWHGALHIYPDNDKPGENLYQQLVSLANQMRVCIIRHSLPIDCKDYSDYYGSIYQSSNNQ